MKRLRKEEFSVKKVWGKNLDGPNSSACKMHLKVNPQNCL